MLKAARALGAPAGPQVQVPPEMTPISFALLLLHIGAELEHALMVEYLYAGYSLGGPQVPEAHRQEVQCWQETILGIAKEEMGHLITVQNLLRCLGGPLNLDREDYPWDSELYPYPFELEPLTRASLAKYVVAESPADWKGSEADEIRELAKASAGGSAVHPVGILYHRLRTLLADESVIPDSAFRGSTYPYQANWDEWGRGYQAGKRGNATGGAMPQTPNVLVMPIAGRDDALAAIDAITTQGEATSMKSDDDPSHFARFLRIFRAWPKHYRPSRPAATNPFVTTSLGEEATARKAAPRGPAAVAKNEDEDAQECTRMAITHPETRLWAHLCNVRYQLLLHCLLRTFEYTGSLDQQSSTTPRGLLVHATFGEMYNLRALSTLLVESPLTADGGDGQCAGPPFQLPYTMRLPVEAIDRWHVHREMLRSCSLIANELEPLTTDARRGYLGAMRHTDGETCKLIDTILRHLESAD
jgi:hypothetical protein